MITKLILPITFFTFLVSCGNSEVVEEQVEKLPEGHTISGKISGADGQFIKLIVVENNTNKNIDSVKITDGAYTLHTQTKELREYALVIGQEMIILFLDKEDNDIKVNGSMPGLSQNYEISGSALSEDVHEYMLFIKQDYAKELDIINQVNMLPPGDSKDKDYLMKRLDTIFQAQRSFAISKIEEDSSSPVSWLMLGEFFPVTGMTGFDTMDLQYFVKVSDGMRERYPESEYPGYIDTQIANIRSQLTAMNAETTTGGLAPEIVLNDRNGKPLALSSLRGKVVLIDFWASWCMPCRGENPNVVRVYDKYKDKGFTVYSVSLDENRDAWLKAIDDDNLKWPNHVSDLKGWNSAPVTAYDVTGIPATFLLDKDGNIIAKNLRGPQLEEKLKEVLD